MDGKQMIENVNTAVSTGKVIAKYVSNTSLTKLAKDSIFQFPVIISASIDNDEIFVMAKSFERSYASMMVSVISMSSYIDLNKYGKEDYLVNFLRRFHSNTNIGGNIIASESISISDANILPQENVVGVNVAALWDSVYESVDNTSINDMYRPFKRTTRILEDALEAATDDGMTIKFGKTTIKNADNIANSGKSNVFHEEYEKDDDGNYKTDKNGKKIPIKGTQRITHTAKDKHDKFNQVVKADYMTDMAPTMINITVIADATGKGDTWTQNVVLGIKAMVRMVKSGVMVNNMMDAFKDRGLFKWLSWTKGEISTAELIFGAGKAMQDGYAAGKGDNWLKILRERKMVQGINKILGKRLLPNASIVITESEALAIKEATGVDPHNPADVQKMMNRYFLLAFGIYDTENKLLDVMYDGESQFSTESIRELAAKNKKDTNLLAMNKY